MIKNDIHIILLFFCTILFAQESIRFSTKQGLPSNHIYDMQEDANGFMWFATNRGLVKYDGENFRTFTIKDGLPNNDTWLLETDYQDRLWYFSKSNYQGYLKKDSIYKFETEDKIVVTPRFTFKTKDRFWYYGSNGLQSLKNGIINNVWWSIRDSKFHNKKLLAIQKKHGFGSSKLMPCMLNPSTKEIVFISKKKLYIYDWEYNFKKEISVNIPVKYMNPDIQNYGLLYNNMGYFAMGKGVLFLNYSNYKTTYKSFKELTGVDNINYFRLRSLKNEFQISVPGHLLIFDYNLQLKEKYTFSKEISQSSYQDAKGNIWLASFKTGISLLTNTQLNTDYFLPNKKTQKIARIDESLIVGVNDDGFYQLNKRKNNFELLVGDIAKSNGEIYQIKTNPKALVTAGKSFTFKNKKWKLINYTTKYKNKTLKEIRRHSIKNIEFHQDKKYVISASYIGLLKKDILDLLYYQSGLLHLKSFKNKLYVAGSFGLREFVKDTIVNLKINNPLLNVSVSSISKDASYLLVGTDGRGAYIYDEDKVTHLQHTDGYSIQKIIKKENLLWLATNNGVHQITLNSGDLENSKITNSFYESDGLLQNNVNDIYIEKDTLYATSDVGLAKLTINNTIYNHQPKIYFKTKKDTLVFKEDKRDNIAITFVLQDFTNQEYVNYQYRLVPTQNNWTTTITKTLNFTNLSPDIYTLEVKATDQHFNSTIKKQYLKVVPFWYETKLAIFGFMLAFIALLVLIFYFIKKRVQQKALEKTEQDKRIAGLELQALRSQMNPHFVHNSLNAIQYFIQRNEVELSENYLSKFSRLIRLFFEYSRRQNITLKEEIELLTNYLEIEKLRFEDKLSFQFHVDEKLELDEKNIPSMILQPIVENAVNHGLFHKKENGEIAIHFKYVDDNTYQVIVLDNGIGIKKSKEIYKNSSKNYRSNSTQVLKERLHLLEQSKLWNIDFKITDLSEIKEKEGTKVSITFKEIAP